MNVKTYQAPTMAQAIGQVKQDLGRDAVILRTRQRRTGWLWGLLGGSAVWEVTAGGHLDAPSAGRYAPRAAGPPAAGKKPRRTPARAGTVGQEVGEIRRMVEALLSMQSDARKPARPELRELHQALLRQEVSEDLADELVGELSLQLNGRLSEQAEAIRHRLKSLIRQRVMTSQDCHRPAAPDRARVAVFIGPTGVGKTTTIAKLAANFKLREGRKVGMVTIDTYRIAAVDQLKTYAELIEVPLFVVLTPGELAQAIDSMKDCQAILVDTAGRSQNDRLRLNQLGAFLKVAEPDDVNLLISATSSRSAVVSTLERFMPLGVNGIVMTKLDEAIALGSVLNVAAVSRLPIRYVTTGQDVPDDIAPADPHRLADCIVEGRLYVA